MRRPAQPSPSAALRRQAESFAEFAAGAPCRGATADDAIAALTAAEQVSAAIPAMASEGWQGT